MEELLPGAQTLGLYEASLLLLLLVEKRYRNWTPGWWSRGDARGRALRAMIAHLGVALQIGRRLRAESAQADAQPDDLSPAVVQPDEMLRQLETVIVKAWLQLDRRGADPLAHLAEFSRLGDSVVLRFCEALLERSMFDAELFYRIGGLFEERGHLVRALDIYRRVVALDPSFRDVPARIAALGGLTNRITSGLPTKPVVLTPTPAPASPAPRTSADRPVSAPSGSVGSTPVISSPQSSARIELASLAAVVRPAPSPGEQELRAAVAELAQKLDQISHFEVLGVAETATPAEINTAMLRASRRFHPDRLSTTVRDLAPQAERIMARISEAAAVLSDPKRRAEYVAACARAREPSPASAMDAEFSFRKGLSALNNGNHAQAIHAFRAALQKKPQDPDYQIYLTWAQFDDPGSDKSGLARDTLAKIEAFLADHPQFGRGHYWVGMIWKFLNDTKKAGAAFKTAISHDKSVMEAERELRLLHMRRERR